MDKTFTHNENWAAELFQELCHEYLTTTAAALFDSCIEVGAVNAWPLIEELLFIGSGLLHSNILEALPTVTVVSSLKNKKGKEGEALIESKLLSDIVRGELNRQYNGISMLLFSKAKKLGISKSVSQMLKAVESGLDTMAQSLEDALPMVEGA